ncbi:carrier with solute carrier repeats [Schizosaccharomyces japonicus yFS275]|uniref:Mitochondrial glycine transporter n=1 Tax=Schizosaccharomyces japonicus (strain yFS275 / FY16936) TaxID=402676 RepID=B6K8A6_SCHJY|nr:carrier with solute carrier repeats [Schizosaccharomyces japonicus yFS275]EEB09760.1 carrier with solute carrier repeats [Schizosaccharomyces japonicus yFS275]
MSLKRKEHSSPHKNNHLAAGAVAGFVSSAALQPLDLLKTRLQQGKHESLFRIIVRVCKSDGGVMSLWRGTFPSILRSTTGVSCYFYTLNLLRTSFGDGGAHFSAKQNFWMGAAARSIVGFFFMPVTVLKVRYESSHYSYNSFLEAVKDIWKKEGISGYFRGFGATALRDAPHAGIYVFFYEKGKEKLSNLVRVMQRNQDSQLEFKNTINVVSGLISGTAATILTNPFDLLKTRVQVYPDRYRNFVQASKMILKEEGIKGFFDGFGLRVVRKTLSSTIAWSIYEWVLAK